MMTNAQPATETDAATRVQVLIDVTQSLNLIFEQENTALDARRPSDLAPLQAEKARLAAAFATGIRAVAADRASVSTVDTTLLRRLRDITATFENHAARQRDLLDQLQ